MNQFTDIATMDQTLPVELKSSSQTLNKQNTVERMLYLILGNGWQFLDGSLNDVP